MESRLEIINDILCGSSSRMRRSYFAKNYPDILDQIEQFCSNIDVPFKQMIWHWVNVVSELPKCECGKKTSFNRNWLDGYKKSCSAKCAQSKKSTKEKRKKTVLKKYGVDNVAKSDDIKKKQAITNLERYGATSSFQNHEVKMKWKSNIRLKYGVDHYFKTDEFKEKAKFTNNEKYGVDYFVQSSEYIKKVKKTNNEKYGVDWFTMTDEFKECSKKSNMDKYGVDHYTKSDEYKNRVNKHYIEKYGVEWFFQTDDFKDMSRSTMVEKYKSEYFSQSEAFKDIIESEEYKQKRLRKRYEFYENLGFEFISQSQANKTHVRLKSKICGHEFEINPTTLQRRIHVNIEPCSVCNTFDSSSGQEDNIKDWLTSLGIEFTSNDRSVISPFELDCVIRSHGLAIEYNGLYWHSEFYKSNNYHLDKMLACERVGIRLIHIFEDDWLYKNSIVKSIIRNALNLTEKKIYARKCVIREIFDKEMVDKFFEDNHIQGTTKFRTALGLFYEGEMVSCMLFNKPRKENELVRFSNIKDVNVIGSASRLFKFYVKNNNVTSISSFADRSMFTGSVYDALGFEFSHRTPPNFWWVVDGVRRHRFSFSKQKLVKMGYSPDKSESEIMRSIGNYRIFGTGLDKWVWVID